MAALSNKHKLFCILPLAALILALAAFVEWPYMVQTPCYFSADEEWQLIQDNPARLISRLKNNAMMRIQSYTLFQFDRQDFVQLFFNPDVVPGQALKKDQVIGEITSSENRILLANLQGQLNKARAGLSILITGEKEAVQKEAGEALNYAKIQYEKFLPQFNRNRELHRQKMISDEEWELSDNTEALLRQNIQLQQAKLRIVQSGEKRETVRMTQEEISRIVSQLELLQAKISLGRILTPIAGVFSSSEGDSILCTVSGIDSIVCTMAVRSDLIPYIRRGQPVMARQVETGFREIGRILSVNPKGTLVSGKSEFMVTALFPNVDRLVLPGMIGWASIMTHPSSLLERIRRAWNRSAGQISF
jgi:multidrug efflux pump subunit AcrA (membrane-fusion protein)